MHDDGWTTASNRPGQPGFFNVCLQTMCAIYRTVVAERVKNESNRRSLQGVLGLGRWVSVPGRACNL